MKHLKKLFFACCFLVEIATAQSVKTLSSGSSISIRGLSVLNDKTIWVSGNKGTIGKSLDGGETWKWLQVKGFEQTDFRDIEVLNETTAIIMAVDSPAYILRTADGGATWKVVFENKTKGMFLDAMEFWNDESGIAIGDPINKHFFIARTFDGGNNWQQIPASKLPEADSGEACFAASGTNIRKLNQREAIFVSGGLKSRIFIRDKKIDLPIVQGNESSGANSIAIKNERTFIVTGGNYLLKDSTYRNCFITKDAGKTWLAPTVAPHGYRSCVEYLSGKKWISCGLNGVDYSDDDGKNWRWISKSSFNVCRKAKTGKAVFLAGDDGKIAKLILE